jgi:hypothetical protein
MEPEKKSNGALIGSIIILIILIVGGIYLFKNIRNQNELKNMSDTITEGEEDAELGTEIDMQAELESIDLESLDSDL